MTPHTDPEKLRRMTMLRALHLLHGYTAGGTMTPTEVSARVRTAVGDVLHDELVELIEQGKYPQPGTDQWVGWYARAVVALRGGRDAPTLADITPWAYRVDRDGDMSTFGVRDWPGDDLRELAELCALETRVGHVYYGTLNVRLWPEREKEHYRLPVPPDAHVFVFGPVVELQEIGEGA